MNARPFLAAALILLPNVSRSQSPPVPDGATATLIADGFKFTEGPALAPDGRIFFSDIPNARIHVYDPKTGKVSVHREASGGANGLVFDTDGALLACEMKNRRVSREFNGRVEPYAEAWEGKRFNQTNDLDLDGGGGIFFTDPNYGQKEDVQMETEGVYHRAKDGRITRVAGSLRKPNGIAVAADHKTLYVADNGAGSIHAFDITPDYSARNGRLLTPDAPGCDGMKSDERGNLHVTCRDGVRVFDPAGKQIGVIRVPQQPANCCFGPRGTRTLYITARSGFYRVRLNVDGAR